MYTSTESLVLYKKALSFTSMRKSQVFPEPVSMFIWLFSEKPFVNPTQKNRRACHSGFLVHAEKCSYETLFRNCFRNVEWFHKIASPQTYTSITWFVLIKAYSEKRANRIVYHLRIIIVFQILDQETCFASSMSKLSNTTGQVCSITKSDLR